MVTALRYLGSGTRLSVRVGDADLAAFVPAGQPLPAEGQVIALAFDPAALHLMEGEG